MSTTRRTSRPGKPAARPIVDAGIAAYGAAVRETPTNTDMLAWFPESERHRCSACGEWACVSLPEALASFCLFCDAITIEGERSDVDRRIPL